MFWLESKLETCFHLKSIILLGEAKYRKKHIMAEVGSNRHADQKYSFLAKSLHWFFVILFAYGIYKQVDDIEQLEDITVFWTEIIFATIFLLFCNSTLVVYGL